MKKEMEILYHADDFGSCMEVSKHIMDCFHGGALNSFSILPNGKELDSCMKLAESYREEICFCTHFNLLEGPCMAEPQRVRMLIDDRGMMKLSFMKVLLLALSPKRKALKEQLKLEMKAQLEAVLPYIDSIRVDSHQHYHMIPIVLESILEAIHELPQTRAGQSWLEKDNHVAEVEFIRIPVEPVLLSMRHPELYSLHSFVNLIKNLILWICYKINTRLLLPYRKKHSVFFGIIFSGQMNIKRVQKLKEIYKTYAQKRGLPLEILCHPGGTSSANVLMDPQNKACVSFYMSSGRKEEKNMMLHILD